MSGLTLPKLCMFDLDGTLVQIDNSFFCKQAKDIYHSLGVASPSEQDFMNMLRTNLFFADVEDNIRKKFADEFWKKYDKLSLPEPIVIDCALEVLEFLLSLGSLVAIITARTSASEEVRNWLSSSKILEFIDHLSSLGDQPLDKREPGLNVKSNQIIDVCKKYGIDPKNSLMAGDCPADIASARNAGVALSVAVLSGASERLSLESQNPNLLLESIKFLPINFES